MDGRIVVGGWHPALHRLEVQTLLEAEGISSEVEHPRVLRVDSEDLHDAVLSRSSSISRWLLGGARLEVMNTETLLETIQSGLMPGPPETADHSPSIAVLVEHIDGGGAEVDNLTLRVELGTALATLGWRIDLQAPDYELVIVYVGEDESQHPEVESIHREEHILWGLSQPADSTAVTWKERTGPMRPFFRPVSLDPRVARAMVNLAHPQSPEAGIALADPFCGTGGLLLEACLVGIPSLGFDLDPEMVAGSAANLDWLESQHGPSASVQFARGDALSFEVDSPVQAFAFDPPYGRNSWRSSHGLDLFIGALGRCAANGTADARLVTLLPWPTDHLQALRRGEQAEIDSLCTFDTPWSEVVELIRETGWVVRASLPIGIHATLSRLLVVCARQPAQV